MTRHPYPQIDGTVSIDELSAPVEILRDRWGVPHIYAQNIHDLFFAQGYVHAQDRFYQMEFWRRIGQGRLSEMLGESALEQDRFIRTIGWWRTAEMEASQLQGEAQQVLQAYADGVNAYIQSRRDALALEFAILRLIGTQVEIEPWRPAHSLVWGKVMAWDLGGNMDLEIYRSRILSVLGEQGLAELTPAYPDDHPIIVPQNVAWDQLQLEEITAFGQLDLAFGKGRGIGSNNWVVSGNRTTTGMPLLANDMHLGIQMPSIWYEVGLHCSPSQGSEEDCPYQVTGFSFPGAPGVIVGHNERIGWGVTNVGPDVQDLYIEQVNPENPDQYRVGDGWADFQVIHEEIPVAGWEEPETIEIKISRHGPILTPVLEDPPVETDQVLALRWTALEPSGIFEAVLLLNKAQDWNQFRQALTNWHVPSQNFVYADIEGNIGYQMPGRIPIRANGDGQLPVPGWTEEYEWTGYIPFAELPRRFNPPEGFVVTANHAVVDADYPYLISRDWAMGYRAQRITEMIENREHLSPTDFKSIQGDNKSLSAAEVIPYLTALQPAQPELRQALNRLQNWDMQEHKDSPEAALYEAIWIHLIQALFDELPPDLRLDTHSWTMLLVRNWLAEPENHWWDDTSTPEIETRDDLLLYALREGYRWLEQRYGDDMQSWAWGRLHTASFRNQSLGESGIGIIEAIFNRGPIPTSGGNSIVNATSWSINNPALIRSVPSERMILDFSDLQRSWSMHTTGQSGHPFHRHYGDMILPWRDIEYHVMQWERETVEKKVAGMLRLEP
jgi:penicillin amidase